MKQLHNQEERSSSYMRPDCFDHPAIDVLERFALRRCSEDEIETIETHILACESCVCALENLELEIAATKLALQEIAAESPQRTLEPERRNFNFWKSWFSLSTLSWAGASIVACAFCLFTFVPVSIDLTADRGVASVIVPEWRNAQLELVDEGLPVGPLQAEVVNQTGVLVWSGSASSVEGKVNLNIPRITEAGQYYARLYAPGAEHDLLSEFPFEVKFQF